MSRTHSRNGRASPLASGCSHRMASATSSGCHKRHLQLASPPPADRLMSVSVVGGFSGITTVMPFFLHAHRTGATLPGSRNPLSPPRHGSATIVQCIAAIVACGLWPICQHRVGRVGRVEMRCGRRNGQRRLSRRAGALAASGSSAFYRNSGQIAARRLGRISFSRARLVIHMIEALRMLNSDSSPSNNSDATLPSVG